MRVSWRIPLCLAATALAALFSCGTEPMHAGTETGNGTGGMVLGLSGKPVPGARVTLVPADYNELEPPSGSFMICSGQTDSLGQYRFVNIAAGWYNLFGDSGANRAFLDSVYIAGKPGDTIKTVSLKRNGSLTGTVLYSSGRSLDYAFVALQGSRIYASIDPNDGNFHLPDLAPGRYLAKVVTRSNGYFNVPVAVTVDEGKSDTLANPFLLVSNSVTSLACDTAGLWIGTTNGLANLRNGAWRVYGLYDGLSSSRINCISVDKSGVVWVGTSLRLARIKNDSLTESIMPQNIPSMMNITALAADSAGNLWMGTPQGLFLYSKGGVTQITGNDALLAGGLASPQNELTAVTAIVCLQPEILVGTMHGMYWRDSGNVWNAVTGLADYAVSSMTSGGRNKVWIGTNQGLRIWDLTGRTLSVPADSTPIGAVTCLALSGGDSLYVGSANGLFLYGGSRFQKIDIFGGSPSVNALSSDLAGALWIGTNDGIIKLDNGLAEVIR